MFLINGEYDEKIEKPYLVESFSETNLFDVGERPDISDSEIIEAQKIMNEKGKIWIK